MASWALRVISLSFCFGSCVAGPHEFYYTKSVFPAPLFPQFTWWWPGFHDLFHDLSSETCNVTLHDYQEAAVAPRSSTTWHELLSRCYHHEACILDNLAGNQMANLQGASVILGLMPVVLSNVGISVAELGHLSSHRPILSFFLSLGAPAILSTRLLDYGAMTKKEQNGRLAATNVFMNRSTGPKMMYMVSGMQYILAFSSAANLLFLSKDLGTKSVLAWGCTSQFLPLMWTLIPATMILVTSLGFALVSHRPKQHIASTATMPLAHKTFSFSSNFEPAVSTRINSKPVICYTVTKHAVTSLFGKLTRCMKKELTPCLTQSCSCMNENITATPSWVTDFLIAAAGCGGYVHIVFGITVFSCLQFITVWDVFNRILWRYLLSSITCRIIVIYETWGIRNHDGEQ